MNRIYISLLLLLTCSFLAIAATPNPPAVSHKIAFTLNPTTQMLTGIDTISIHHGNHKFYLAKKCDASIVDITDKKNEPLKLVTANLLAKTDAEEWEANANAIEISGPKTVVANWSGVFNDSSANVQFSREQVAGVPEGVIAKQGIFLSTSALFYPIEFNTVHEYTVTISTPSGWTPITTGLRTKIGLAPEGFVNWSFGGPWQNEGLSIAAGEFIVRSTDTLGISIETCFSPARDSLAPTYLAAAKKYIARYSREFGAYPWPSFAMVEAFFPAGYGLPGYTFLGSEVIALPFIVTTSLGHEVLHNWWGNGVFVSSSGNWCEGLTTFGADWAYKTDRGEDAEYRRGLIKDYASYVNNGNDFPLRKFTSRSSGATRAVGYNKCAFLFYALKNRIGDDAFNRALQRFYAQYRYRFAGWDELRECFQQEAPHESLKYFFRDWIDETGAVELKNLSMKNVGKTTEISLAVSGKPFPTWIPAKLSNGDSSRIVQIDGRTIRNGKLTWSSAIESTIHNWQPNEVTIDPYYQVWRKPAPGEIPPSLSDLYGAKKVGCWIEGNGDWQLDSALRKLAVSLFDTTVVWLKTTEEFPEIPIVTLRKDISKTALYLHEPTPEQKLLFGKPLFEVKNEGKRIVGLISVDNLAGVSYLQRKAPHYGKYSRIVFDETGKNIIKDLAQPGKHALHYVLPQAK